MRDRRPTRCWFELYRPGGFGALLCGGDDPLAERFEAAAHRFEIDGVIFCHADRLGE